MSGQRQAQTALYPRERTPGTHWIGGWVGLRVGPELDGCSLCLECPVSVNVLFSQVFWMRPEKQLCLLVIQYSLNHVGVRHVV
jgi:hypothetical protein